MDRPTKQKQRLGVYSLGMLWLVGIRRILRLAGWRLIYAPLAWGRVDAIGIWGRKPSGRRGQRAAVRRNLPLVTTEDAFLRSVEPGRKAPPLGMMIDPIGVHFDAARPSMLENCLNADPRLDDGQLLSRATQAIAFMQRVGLSKYNKAPRGAYPLPKPGYVLVIDQSHNDASVQFGGADENTFRQMLAAARAENPGCRIVLRSHPVTSSGRNRGYFSNQDCDENTSLWPYPCNPWDLLEGAKAVYCVTSQLGFEAILAGHRPQVFGKPFFAGWGLSDDRQAMPRRQRQLSVAQLFVGAMILAPVWHDPFTKSLCTLERALHILEARARAHWALPKRSIATKMRRWKRRSLNGFLNKPIYCDPPETALASAMRNQKPMSIWASQMPEHLAAMASNAGVRLVRVEDGFLRSIGLGARLVPAQSLVLDDLGIYFDPTSPSRLEQLIADAAKRPCERGAALRQSILAAKLSKYNLGGGDVLPTRDGRLRILVPGQVEDDASIRCGAVDIRTNAALLKATRSAFPEACIIYKPHPDVVAGLRKGAVPNAAELADIIVENAAPATLFAQVDRVATITSLMGFEALLAGLPVTCFGCPFYAGWGLTDDRVAMPERRSARPTVDQLAEAALVDYPLYRDPVTCQPCPPEVLVERIIAGQGRQPTYLRVMSRLQRLLHI